VNVIMWCRCVLVVACATGCETCDSERCLTCVYPGYTGPSGSPPYSCGGMSSHTETL